jgi:molybdopterin-synthase adenylyltransferase
VSKRLVTVVGAGALGSHFVQFTRSVDVMFRVIDDDRVEQKNVLAQFHGRPSVGRSKTQSLAQTMDFLFKMKIEGVSNRLVEVNARNLLGGAALVVDCLDNAPSRRIVQSMVRELRVPCLHGALAADGAFGRVVWDEKFVVDEGAAGAPTCEGGEHLPFVALVSAYLARAAQEFLVNGRRVGYEVSPAGAFAT